MTNKELSNITMYTMFPRPPWPGKRTTLYTETRTYLSSHPRPPWPGMRTGL